MSALTLIRRLRRQSAARRGWPAHLAAAALIVLPALLAGAGFGPGLYDDAYITYRHAHNLATGQGFVYNQGEAYLGTSAPLYGLLLGLLGSFRPAAIPALGGAVSLLALALAGLGLYALGCAGRRRLGGLLAGMFLVLNPLLLWTLGGEMPVQAALVIWAAVAYARERGRLAAALLGLAILTRPDAALAAAAFGLHMLLARRRPPWRELLTLLAVVLPWLAATRLIYGQYLPGTLAAKAAQRDSGLWLAAGKGMVEWVKAFTWQGSSAIFPLPAAPGLDRLAILAALGLPALWRQRFWLPLLGWAALHGLAYWLAGAPFYHWYVVPVACGLMILAGAGAAGLADAGGWLLGKLAGWSDSAGAERAAAGLGLALLLALAPGLLALARFSRDYAAGLPGPQTRQYVAAGRWLRDNTPAGASVGYLEIGLIGYHSERRIIDPLGLVNRGTAPHVAARELSWAYGEHRPDYIIHNPVFFPGQLDQFLGAPWFAAEYREAASIEEPGAPPLTIFERRPAAARGP